MKKLLKTLLATGILLIALIVIKNEYARFLMSDANYGLQALIARSGREARTGKEYDIYLGSSMFRQGLDIEELEQSGENPYILSYNGAQPFLIYRELEYLLDHQVKIRSITVDLFVNSIQREPWVEDPRLFLDTDLRFKVGLWKEMRETTGASWTDLWEMLVTANNEKLLTWYVDYPLVNSMFRNGGNLVVNSAASGDVLDGQLGSTEHHTGKHFEMNERQVDSLLDIIRLCRREGISLRFVETPKYRTAVCEQAYTDVMQAYCRLLRENMVEYYLTESTVQSLQKYCGVNGAMDEAHIVPFDTTNPDDYTDVIHLSSEGRKCFTHNLIETMQRAEQGTEVE